MTSTVWNEIGPSEHFVQFYDDDAHLIDAIDQFIGSGLAEGDGGVVIGTPAHLRGIERRLRLRGLDMREMLANDQYIPLDAEETLAKFMCDDWPNQMRFEEVMGEVLARVSRGGRRVRAFGEMVGLLYAKGNRPATIRLEKLWNQLAQTAHFGLFCAYPKSAFDRPGTCGTLIDICCEHSRVLTMDPSFALSAG